jgi:hypothetical protein
MRMHQWFRNGMSRSGSGSGSLSRSPGRGRLRPRLEQFEDRTLLSSYTAGSVSDLINDINTANAAGGANTITLATRTTFTLTQVNNTSDGPTGLPVVAAGDNLTIVGNNDTIQRSSVSGIPSFRLFDVASGASLTLENMTLQFGEIFGAGGNGGEIYSNGDLALSGVNVFNGTALAAGSGVYVAGGAANLSNDAFAGNYCEGTGVAGGAVCIVGGTANLTGDTFDQNTAPNCFAGAIYVGGGTVTLSGDLVQDNPIFGPAPPAIYVSGGVVTFCHDTVKDNGGGGIDIVGGSVGIDQFTVVHTTKNSPYNIQGTYTLIPNC